MEIHVQYEPAAGPTAAAETLAARRLQVDVFGLAAEPALDSVELHLGAVLALRGRPLRAASSLRPGTRWGMPAPAAVVEGTPHLGSVTGIVAAGWSTTFSTSVPHLPEFRCEPAADGVRLALRTDTGRDRGIELAVLRDPLGDGAALLFVPATGAGFAGHAIRIGAGGLADAAEIDAAVAANGPKAPPAAPAGPGTDPIALQWQLAAESIGAQPRRGALLALATNFGLPACVDVLLAADETNLIAIGAEVGRLDPVAADRRFDFERAVWSALLPAMQREELPLGLRSAVLRRLGILALEPATLQRLLATSHDAAAFAAGAQAENLEALGDRDPVHRLRAHEYLAEHGLAVPDYAPLDPPERRAAALRAHAPTESSP
ncbi:MAG: hypothetical protein KF830_00685 [Planctomycetes bacterium]|nr:hypothetical protein [Planctomycetota bacterium]